LGRKFQLPSKQGVDAIQESSKATLFVAVNIVRLEVLVGILTSVYDDGALGYDASSLASREVIDNLAIPAKDVALWEFETAFGLSVTGIDAHGRGTLNNELPARLVRAHSVAL
jgi:hypothetical protein